MKKWFFLLAAALFLCACGVTEPAEEQFQPEISAGSTPEPTAVPTPEPTPEPTSEPTPEPVTLDGRSFGPETRELVLTDTAGLAEALRAGALPELAEVDLTACEITDGEFDELCAIRPETEFVRTVTFCGVTVRSDITCFSTLHAAEGEARYTEEDFAPLFRYCTRLRALDLGHNGLKDVSGLKNLKELRVLILSDNPYISDLTPLGELTELEYLECFCCERAADYGFLEKLTRLRALNLCYCTGLASVDFVREMPALEMLWILNDRAIPAEELRALRETRPELAVYFTSSDPASTGGGWRDTEENAAIRAAFADWPKVREFRSWDDVVFIQEDEG